MSWTDERIELLRKSWESGMTASQIAESLGEGVSRNAVIGKAHRLGLQARPSPVKLGEAVITAVETVVAVVAGVVDGITAPPTRPPAPRRPTRPAAASKPALTTLLDLSEKVCKWPIGHPGETVFHFCGKPSQTGFPYCSEHCAVAYQAQLPRRDRSRPPPPVMPGMRPR
ncbi:MAG: GcrA family cell cycle regulator [Janthinobacterium lividum]